MRRRGFIYIQSPSKRMLAKLFVTLFAAVFFAGCNQLVEPLQSLEATITKIGYLPSSSVGEFTAQPEIFTASKFVFAEAFSGDYALFPTQVLKVAGVTTLSAVVTGALQNGMGVIPVVKTVSLNPKVEGYEQLMAKDADGNDLHVFDMWNPDFLEIVKGYLADLKKLSVSAVAFTDEIVPPIETAFSEYSMAAFYKEYAKDIKAASAAEVDEWIKNSVKQFVIEVANSLQEVPVVFVVKADDVAKYSWLYDVFDFVAVIVDSVDDVTTVAQTVPVEKLMLLVDGSAVKDNATLQLVLKAAAGVCKFIGIYGLNSSNVVALNF